MLRDAIREDIEQGHVFGLEQPRSDPSARVRLEARRSQRQRTRAHVTGESTRSVVG
jgi:hypothetical protein